MKLLFFNIYMGSVIVFLISICLIKLISNPKEGFITVVGALVLISLIAMSFFGFILIWMY